MKFGIDRLLEEPALRGPLAGRRVALLAHPASVTRDLTHSLDALAPQWLRGCRLRPCWFEPTFHKHAGKLCAGFQVHVEDPTHYDHQAFRPWRLIALAFKALRALRADYPLWRDFPYEYEQGRLAIDVINGGELLRRWVDDPVATPADLDALAAPDEAAWDAERQQVLLY